MMARESSGRVGLPHSPRSAIKIAGAALIAVALTVHADQVDIAGPAGSTAFGTSVTVLPNGNIVVTDPSGPVSNVGAVYLYSPTGVLLSTLTGSSANDAVGSGGVFVLSNGHYVVSSPFWNNGATAQAGAVTWCNGSTGLEGVVSSANSLIGTTDFDLVGSNGITALSSGHYVVRSPNWDNGATADAGAVTWGNGSIGLAGAVSSSNSLVGTTLNDSVGSAGVTALSNGHYVVRSPVWNNGTTADVGAVTWGNGSTGLAGAVSPSNSLIGTAADDRVGSASVTALSNGNYVVRSPAWDNGISADAGAVTWGNGSTGIAGAVSASNSLIGTMAADQVGSDGISLLSNGHYVVRSPFWNNGAGAATWGNGGTGRTGVVSPANSLVGTTPADQVGGGVTALSNGNYVVPSSTWDDGGTANVGAVTWANGSTGLTGVVSSANSLIGTTEADQVGSAGVTALSNGHYVVRSPIWDNGITADVGAVTWGNGSVGLVGVVSSANSLIGTTAADQVGAGVNALSNGHYVVRTPAWDDGVTADVGAVTWGNGSTGLAGAVSPSNSLIGTTNGDQVGSNGVTALSNGNYVVRSPNWRDGGTAAVGAVTWGNGSIGLTGTVSPTNSLVGSTLNDLVGNAGVAALSNGHYVVRSPFWNNGGAADAGAVTWCNGSTGLAGAVSPSNSLIGTTPDDRVGSAGITEFGDGRYVVRSPLWDNDTTLDAGAITLGRGDTSLFGIIVSPNSVRGAVDSGGISMVFAYDVARGQLVVGQPASNLVSLFALPPDLIFADGFE